MSKKNGSGYSFAEQTATLKFEGGEYDGLVVTASLEVPMGTTLRIQELQGISDDAKEKPEAIREILTLFADFLVSWNIVDRSGAAVPATIEGLLSLPTTRVTTILNAWRDAMVNHKAPLVETVSG